MIRTKRSVVFAVMAVGISSTGWSAELKPDTVKAWRQYMRATESSMQSRLNTGKSFLWIDEAEGRNQQVRRGEIVVEPVAGHGRLNVPNGLIHHWIGAVFIPNVSARNLLAVVDDYESYKDIYKPAVVDSRALGSNAADQEFSMVWLRHVLFVDAAVQGRYRAHTVVIDARRGYSAVDASCIQQIENYGHPGQRILPPDTGAGFIWRIHSVSRYQERDGGVYLEIEAIALSRDIPPSLRWMVNPVVNHLSINSLRTTLSQTRQAVLMQQPTPTRIEVRAHGPN